MNNKYKIINYIFESRNKDVKKTEEDFKKIMNSWVELERQISEKRLKKMIKNYYMIILKKIKNIFYQYLMKRYIIFL